VLKLDELLGRIKKRKENEWMTGASIKQNVFFFLKKVLKYLGIKNFRKKLQRCRKKKYFNLTNK
jgi:hypothetical protein